MWPDSAKYPRHSAIDPPFDSTLVTHASTHTFGHAGISNTLTKKIYKHKGVKPLSPLISSRPCSKDKQQHSHRRLNSDSASISSWPSSSSHNNDNYNDNFNQPLSDLQRALGYSSDHPQQYHHVEHECSQLTLTKARDHHRQDLLIDKSLDVHKQRMLDHIKWLTPTLPNINSPSSHEGNNNSNKHLQFSSSLYSSSSTSLLSHQQNNKSTFSSSSKAISQSSSSAITKVKIPPSHRNPDQIAQQLQQLGVVSIDTCINPFRRRLNVKGGPSSVVRYHRTRPTPLRPKDAMSYKDDVYIATMSHYNAVLQPDPMPGQVPSSKEVRTALLELTKKQILRYTARLSETAFLAAVLTSPHNQPRPGLTALLELHRGCIVAASVNFNPFNLSRRQLAAVLQHALPVEALPQDRLGRLLLAYDTTNTGNVRYVRLTAAVLVLLRPPLLQLINLIHGRNADRRALHDLVLFETHYGKKKHIKGRTHHQHAQHHHYHRTVEDEDDVQREHDNNHSTTSSVSTGGIAEHYLTEAEWLSLREDLYLVRLLHQLYAECGGCEFAEVWDKGEGELHIAGEHDSPKKAVTSVKEEDDHEKKGHIKLEDLRELLCVAVQNPTDEMNIDAVLQPVLHELFVARAHFPVTDLNRPKGNEHRHTNTGMSTVASSASVATGQQSIGGTSNNRHGMTSSDILSSSAKSVATAKSSITRLGDANYNGLSFMPSTSLATHGSVQTLLTVKESNSLHHHHHHHQQIFKYEELRAMFAGQLHLTADELVEALIKHPPLLREFARQLQVFRSQGLPYMQPGQKHYKHHSGTSINSVS